MFRLLPRGFTHRDLRIHLAPQLGLPPEHMTSGQITYDLRRLRMHGLIERIPRTHRYRVTDPGLRYALFLTRAHTVRDTAVSSATAVARTSWVADHLTVSFTVHRWRRAPVRPGLWPWRSRVPFRRGRAGTAGRCR